MTNENTTPLLPALPAELPARAAVALDVCRGYHERALAAAQPLLALQPAEVTPELDAQVADWLVKSRRTLEAMQTERAPLTRAFDAVRAEFTTLEAPLDPKKKDSPAAQLQALRDAYASLAAARAEALRRDQEAVARRAEAAAKARAEWRRALEEVEQRQRAALEDHLHGLLQAPIKTLEKLTVDQLVAAAKERYRDQLPPVSFPADLHPADAQELQAEYGPQREAVDLDATLVLVARAERWLADERPALLTARRSKDQAALSEINEWAADQLRREQEATRKAEAQAEARAALAQAEARHAVAAPAVSVPKHKRLVACEVSQAAAYLPLLQLYLRDLPAGADLEALGRVTLARLAAHAGEVATRTGEVVDAPGLLYRETVKTSAR